MPDLQASAKDKIPLTNLKMSKTVISIINDLYVYTTFVQNTEQCNVDLNLWVVRSD